MSEARGQPRTPPPLASQLLAYPPGVISFPRGDFFSFA